MNIPSSLPALSPNLIVIAILVVGAVYGLAAGRQALRLFILSIYVGIVLAEQLQAVVAPYTHPLGTDQLALLLLALPIVIFGFAHRGGKHESKGSSIANAIVGMLAGALIISSALRLLPPSTAASINDDSLVASLLGQFHLWLIGGAPLVVILLGFMKSSEKKHH